MASRRRLDVAGRGRLGVWVAILFSGHLTALEIENGYVRGLPPGQKSTAAFFTLYNDSGRPRTLVRVESDLAQRVEIHRHDHIDGMMQMRQLPELTLAPEAREHFQPGGLHLMLMGLTRMPREGEQVELTFIDDRGERVVAQLPVVSVLNERRHH